MKMIHNPKQELLDSCVFVHGVVVRLYDFLDRMSKQERELFEKSRGIEIAKNYEPPFEKNGAYCIDLDSKVNDGHKLVSVIGKQDDGKGYFDLMRAEWVSNSQLLELGGDDNVVSGHFGKNSMYILAFTFDCFGGHEGSTTIGIEELDGGKMELKCEGEALEELFEGDMLHARNAVVSLGNGINRVARKFGIEKVIKMPPIAEAMVSYALANKLLWRIK